MSGTIDYLKLVITKNSRDIIRKIIKGIMTVSILFCFICFFLTGCSQDGQVDALVNTEREEGLISSDLSSDSLIQENQGEVANAFNVAYADILEEIDDTNTFPDGTNLRYSPDDNISISFAICDVDEDGINELIIEWSNFSANGYMEWVYEYSPERNEYTEELATFDGVEFFEDGLATALLSHNGSGGPLWPYRVLQYDASEKIYKEKWMVQSWSKLNYSEEEYSNITADSNNVGVFYEIDYEGDKKAEMISQAEFDELCQRTFLGTGILDIQFFEFTKENIQKLREGKFDSVLTKKTATLQNVSIDNRNINVGKKLPDGTYSFKLSFVSKLKNTAENMYSVVGRIERKNVYIDDDTKSLKVDDVLLYASDECIVVDMTNPDFNEGVSFNISSFDEYFKDKQNDFCSFIVEVEAGKVVKLTKSK